MSTYWGYRCTDCAVDSPHWLNHGDGLLAEFVEHWDAIGPCYAFAQSNGWLEMSILGCYGRDDPSPLEFLHAHTRHAIVLVNEYGAVKDVTKSEDG